LHLDCTRSGYSRLSNNGEPALIDVCIKRLKDYDNHDSNSKSKELSGLFLVVLRCVERINDVSGGKIMNIDLHSHFFPVEALQNPGRYEERKPRLVLDNGKLSVTSPVGFRPGLGAGAYDTTARVKALDAMSIELQAISPSPILLFYWEEPAVAAHFSRQQNEAIQRVVDKYPARFTGFGSVPLQSVDQSIAMASSFPTRKVRLVVRCDRRFFQLVAYRLHVVLQLFD
jgi:hypothetical protein